MDKLVGSELERGESHSSPNGLFAIVPSPAIRLVVSRVRFAAPPLVYALPHPKPNPIVSKLG
jgi:hypothetical protein